jgi:DNA polymerase III alpha subunit (gram-positive type)
MSRTGPNIIVFDLETGGFKASENPLVEVSFICYDTISMQEIGRYESIVYPYYEHPITKNPLKYTEGAMNTHGISIVQMEKEGKDLKEVIRGSVGFIKSCKTKGMHGKPILIGHNINKFDIPFFTEIAQWFKVDWLKETSDTIDTMNFARLIWPQTSKDHVQAKVINHKLDTFCSALGVELTNAHRASADVEANGNAFLKLLTMMRGGSVSISVEDDKNTVAEPFKF